MKGTESMVMRVNNKNDLMDNLNKDSLNQSKLLQGEKSTKSLVPQRGSKKNNMMEIINQGAKNAESKRKLLRKQSTRGDRASIMAGLANLTPIKPDEKDPAILSPGEQIELKDINLNDQMAGDVSKDSHYIETDDDDKDNVRTNQKNPALVPQQTMN